MSKSKINIMNIKQFIKFELSGWTKKEIITFSAIYIFIIINAVLVKDSPIALLSAICGISYTIIAGKGKISCYFFGLAGSLLYVYLSIRNTIWANALLYGCYYIPMEIIGIIKWGKNLDKKHEIIKTKINNYGKNKAKILTILTAIISVITVIFLYYTNDSHPIIDGTTTILSIAGMYLTVKRCIEQWFIWIIVNLLSMIMWINIVLQGEKAYSTVIMWLIYLFIAIYFYHQWKKSLD